MAYVNIPKPSLGSYTDISKPLHGFTTLVGMATGLICPPTYASQFTLSQPTYTNVAKPSAGNYTNINKPT